MLHSTAKQSNSLSLLAIYITSYGTGINSIPCNLTEGEKINEQINHTMFKLIQPTIIRSSRSIRFQSTRVASSIPDVKTAHYSGPVSLDRDFPDPFAKEKQNRWYFVSYGLGVILSCAAIFNYEKTTSPIITLTFFILRRSTLAKELLGPTIGYSSLMPWISGPLNTVQGRVDISFGVKGEFGKGKLELKAQRETRADPFVFEKFLLIVDEKEYDLRGDAAFDFGL